MRFHDVNFFLKLAAAFLVMLVAWMVPGWQFGVPLAIASVVFLAAVKVPGLRAYLKGAVLLVVLVIASWLVNLTLQGQSLADASTIAAGMAARLVTTTAAFYFVMETSSPGSILAAASAARLPPIVTLVLSLTFGIIPMLREDFERIADAQRARGMEIDDVPFVTRLRFALARGVPLLVQAIRMAHAISISLSIYGFDMKRKRTTWRNVGLLVEPKLNLKDDKA
jgi:ABC-type cobalt transport system, permease component CbiQ and related transporters